ncbi:hypothetical protein BDW71DRAFT_209204 [Aspergillus fruticulosus]
MYSSTVEMQTCLQDLGAVVDDDLLLKSDHAAKLIPYLWSYQQEAFFISDAAEAILSHSKGSLKDIVKLTADDQEGIINLVRLCLLWPDGIATLQEADESIPCLAPDFLIRVIFLELVDAAKALLQIGTPVASIHIGLARSEEMEWAMIQALVAQAERLAKLTKATLPLHVQTDLGMEEARLLDFKAAEACAVLEARASQ